MAELLVDFKKLLPHFEIGVLSERICLPGQVCRTQENQIVGSSSDFLQHPGIYFPITVLGPDLNHAKVGVTEEVVFRLHRQFILRSHLLLADLKEVIVGIRAV